MAYASACESASISAKNDFCGFPCVIAANIVERSQPSSPQVMEANLLLFKTVIAGDSWGEIAVPMIEQYPATAVIFMGSLLTLVFGVLNLIVAVVDLQLNGAITWFTELWFNIFDRQPARHEFCSHAPSFGAVPFGHSPAQAALDLQLR